MSLDKMVQTQKKATDLMKSGESSLKTHLFKWSPNYLEAIPKFMQASSLFENIGDYPQAIKCYEKLAACYEKTEDLYGAADAFYKIGFILLQQKKDPKAAHLYMMKSVNLFKIHGNMLKAQEMLKKLGKQCFDLGYDELGAQIYKDLIDEMLDDQNYGTGSEIISQYLDFLIDKDRFPDAIAVYEKHIKYLQSVKKYEHIIARCWLGIICVHILMGEHYIADEKMGTFGSNITKVSSSDEYSAALNLIDAIQKGDEAAYSRILRRPIFTQMETSLVKRLKKFSVQKKIEIKKYANPLFGNIDIKKAPGQKPAAAAATAQPPAELIPEEQKAPIAPTEAKEEEQKSVITPTEATVEEKKLVEEEKLINATEALTVEEKKAPEVVTEEKKGEKKEEKPETREKQEEGEQDFGGLFT